MRVEFTIPGPPVGKGRPRFTKTGHAYTPQKTRDYEAAVVVAYRQQCGPVCFGPTQPICMHVTAYVPIPPGARKSKKEAMRNGEIRPLVRPDIDNIGKAVADSLNGVAYPDDAQVVRMVLERWYADDPRVEVVLESV